jgi:hypothetical protein
MSERLVVIDQEQLTADLVIISDENCEQRSWRARKTANEREMLHLEQQTETDNGPVPAPSEWPVITNE